MVWIQTAWQFFFLLNLLEFRNKRRIFGIEHSIKWYKILRRRSWSQWRAIRFCHACSIVGASPNVATAAIATSEATTFYTSLIAGSAIDFALAATWRIHRIWLCFAFRFTWKVTTLIKSSYNCFMEKFNSHSSGSTQSPFWFRMKPSRHWHLGGWHGISPHPCNGTGLWHVCSHGEPQWVYSEFGGHSVAVAAQTINNIEIARNMYDSMVLCLIS